MTGIAHGTSQSGASIIMECPISGILSLSTAGVDQNREGWRGRGGKGKRGEREGEEGKDREGKGVGKGRERGQKEEGE